jgi:hypothetical protein
MRLAVTAEAEWERDDWLNLAQEFRLYTGAESSARPLSLERAQAALEQVRLRLVASQGQEQDAKELVAV